MKKHGPAGGRSHPLNVQLVLPAEFLDDPEIDLTYATLAELGFAGVELNIVDPWKTDFEAVDEFLSRYNLELFNFASGLTAKTFGISLAGDDESLRTVSVKRCDELLRLFDGRTSGIILGFAKGPAVSDVQGARERFKRSLHELAPTAVETGVALVVEATNRYESAVANTLDDTAMLIADLPATAARMLPDTFHLNIEETDPFCALERYMGKFDSIHISDNNRRYPGKGAIDFSRIFEHLDRIGFAGPVTIEGNVEEPLSDELRASSDYLSSCIRPSTNRQAEPKTTSSDQNMWAYKSHSRRS